MRSATFNFAKQTQATICTIFPDVVNISKCWACKRFWASSVQIYIEDHWIHSDVFKNVHFADGSGLRFLTLVCMRS